MQFLFNPKLLARHSRNLINLQWRIQEKNNNFFGGAAALVFTLGPSL